VEKSLIQTAFLAQFRPNRVSVTNGQINNEPVVFFVPCYIYCLSVMYNSILRVTFPGCWYNELHFLLSAVMNSILSCALSRSRTQLCFSHLQSAFVSG